MRRSHSLSHSSHGVWLWQEPWRDGLYLFGASNQLDYTKIHKNSFQIQGNSAALRPSPLNVIQICRATGWHYKLHKWHWTLCEVSMFYVLGQHKSGTQNVILWNFIAKKFWQYCSNYRIQPHSWMTFCSIFYFYAAMTLNTRALHIYTVFFSAITLLQYYLSSVQAMLRGCGRLERRRRVYWSLLSCVFFVFWLR